MCICVKARLHLWLVLCVCEDGEGAEGWIELGVQALGTCTFVR